MSIPATPSVVINGATYPYLMDFPSTHTAAHDTQDGVVDMGSETISVKMEYSSTGINIEKTRLIHQHFVKICTQCAAAQHESCLKGIKVEIIECGIAVVVVPNPMAPNNNGGNNSTQNDK